MISFHTGEVGAYLIELEIGKNCNFLQDRMEKVGLNMPDVIYECPLFNNLDVYHN